MLDSRNGEAWARGRAEIDRGRALVASAINDWPNLQGLQMVEWKQEYGLSDSYSSDHILSCSSHIYPPRMLSSLFILVSGMYIDDFQSNLMTKHPLCCQPREERK